MVRRLAAAVALALAAATGLGLAVHTGAGPGLDPGPVRALVGRLGSALSQPKPSVRGAGAVTMAGKKAAAAGLARDEDDHSPAARKAVAESRSRSRPRTLAPSRPASAPGSGARPGPASEASITGDEAGATGDEAGATGDEAGATGDEAGATGDEAGATGDEAGGPVTIGTLLGRERTILQQILDERAELKRVRVGKRVARGELRRLDTRLGELRRRQQGADRALEQRQRRLRQRVRALYRLVRQTGRRPLLDPRRAAVPRDGRRALLRILRRDLSEIRHLRAEQVRLDTAVQQARRRRRESIAVLRNLDRRRDRLHARGARCRQELTAVRHRRKHHRGHAREWDRKAYALEREIVALRLRLQRQVTSFEQRRGKLVRPVPGLIVGWYGEAKVKGTKATAVSRGVEISALPRWKVRAPADARVRFVGRVPTYGNVVVLDHDEGYLSVVGYLGPVLVKEGAEVKGGRPIAALPPPRGRRDLKVYYELRRSGESIDPTPWLRGGLAERRKRGPEPRSTPRSRKRPSPRGAVAQQ
jgi:septal ring factor EnvC (AmiA/AmiB activator)